MNRDAEPPPAVRGGAHLGSDQAVLHQAAGQPDGHRGRAGEAVGAGSYIASTW